MDITFCVLGIVDLVAGGILFIQPSTLVKVIGALIFTKGLMTVIKSF